MTGLKVGVVEVRQQSDGSGVFKQRLHKQHTQLYDLRSLRFKSRFKVVNDDTAIITVQQFAQGCGCMEISVIKGHQ